ncbi:MAG: hypothetical protein GY698_24840 [Actinomycetia bacterium]|nr:hypothetical protein [Actinomycetes bacterium]
MRQQTAAGTTYRFGRWSRALFQGGLVLLLVSGGPVRASTSGPGMAAGLGIGLIAAGCLALSWRVRVIVHRPHITFVNPLSKHQFDVSDPLTAFELRAGVLRGSNDTHSLIRAWGADSKDHESGLTPALNPRKAKEMAELVAQVTSIGGQVQLHGGAEPDDRGRG